MLKDIHIYPGNCERDGCFEFNKNLYADRQVIEKLVAEMSGIIIISQFQGIYTLYSLTAFWRVEE